MFVELNIQLKTEVRSKHCRRRWVECDECKLQYHYKCVLKAHLELYGMEEDDDDDEELAFLCHKCAELQSDEDLAGLLLSDSDD